MNRYRVDFDRIGRNHNPPPLTTRASNPGELAEAVYRHAQPHLVSQHPEVLVSFTDMKVRILTGFHNAGGGTITCLDKEAA